MRNKAFVFCVCGVKNSGKTTLITKLVPLLQKCGLRCAVIKHDGHDFEPDVPGTDTYRFLAAGAAGTAVYSDTKYMMTRNVSSDPFPELAVRFADMDLILVEGRKESTFPKIELIRKGISDTPSCNPENCMAVVTDLPEEMFADLPEKGYSAEILDLNDPESIADHIFRKGGFSASPESTEAEREDGAGSSAMHSRLRIVLGKENDFFGPGVQQLLEYVDRFGSISKAAEEMDMSYSKSWKMVKNAEKETGITFLNRSAGGEKGGGSALTEEGKEFLARYRAYSEKLRRQSLELFEEYLGNYKK